MTAPTDTVRTIAQARTSAVTSIHLDSGEDALVATGRLANFRCCLGRAQATDDGVALSPDCASTLAVDTGDDVLWVSRW